MTALRPGALRHIAEQVVRHRRRVADAFQSHGLDAARSEVSVFVMVGSRPKFLTDDEDRIEFYAIARGMGRELDRLTALDAANRHATRLAKGYVSPALAAATAT